MFGIYYFVNKYLFEKSVGYFIINGSMFRYYIKLLWIDYVYYTYADIFVIGIVHKIYNLEILFVC